MEKEYDGGKLIIAALFEDISTIVFPIKVIDKQNYNCKNEKMDDVNIIQKDIVDLPALTNSILPTIVDNSKPPILEKQESLPRPFNHQ